MDEPESSTKRGKTDVGSIAPAPRPPRAIEIRQIHLNSDGSFPPLCPKFKKGTTVLAFTFEEGIMVAADYSSKSSNRAKNIFELNSHMLATISGGSEILLEKLQNKCRQEEKEGRKTPVEEVLKWLAEIISAHKEKLSIGILIAVRNESERGLYHMNGRGELVKDDILCTGSGSGAHSILMSGRHKYAPSRNTHPFNLR